MCVDIVVKFQCRIFLLMNNLLNIFITMVFCIEHLTKSYKIIIAINECV